MVNSRLKGTSVAKQVIKKEVNEKMNKKHLKITGIFTIVICMIVGLFLAVMDSRAGDSVLYLQQQGATESAEYYVLDEDNIPSYAGYLFAGYYAGANENQPLKSVEGKDASEYYAKFVPEEVLGMKAQVSTNVIDNKVDVIADNAIRFVTSVDSTKYQNIAFLIDVGGYATIDTGKLSVEEGGTDNYVYKEIYAVGTKADDENLSEKKWTYTPAQVFNNNVSTYFKTYTFTDVPKDYFNTDITVTPYWVTYDGTTVCGTTSIRTANYCRGWFYVNSSAYEEGSKNLGTYDNPATLATATSIPVNTQIIPNPK